MIPYFLTFSFILLWVYLEKQAFNRNSFWMPFIVLVGLASVRNNSVGTDSIEYTYNFVNKVNPIYFTFNENVEYGYQLLSYLILNFTHNYFWLFFFSSIIVVGSYLYIIKKYSKDYPLSIFLFFGFGFYTFYFNGLRQGIAMAVCFFALPYLINSNKLKYFLMIFLASLFHMSALIMLPFYFLVHLRLKLEYKMLMTFLSSFLISGILISYLAEQNSRYEGYAQVSESGGGYIILTFYTILGIFLYWLGSRERFLNYNYKIFEQIYLLGLLFVIPIAFLETNPSGPQRILNYFTSMLVFLIPVLLLKFKTNFISYVFYTFMILFFYFTTSRFSNLAPYTLNPIFEIF